MNWYAKRIKRSSNVSLNMDRYSAVLWNYMSELTNYILEKNQSLSNFQFNYAPVRNIFQKYNYPGIASLDAAIDSKDSKSLPQIMYNIWQWKNQQDKIAREQGGWRSSFDQNNELYNAQKALRDYSDYLDQSQPDYDAPSMEKTKQEYDRLIMLTKKNMENIYQSVISSISRIKGWNGTPIIVEASPPDKENFLEPVDYASVEFNSTDEDWRPSFSYFIMDGKIVLDDVLEAGDTDFFTDNKVQADYFNLVKEIRNPGSSEKGGKIITLYTARPVRDRKLYMNATSIPSNLFMTNRYDSAVGLARDLSGGEKARDVWRVKINSMYLIETLNSPEEKQYQIVGDNQVPIHSISLVESGEL